MNNLIIIPDIHGRGFWREAVESRPEDEIIFLGDYLDPYPKEEISESEAFEGLRDIIDLKERNPERVTLLWGNHDLHYLYPEYMGSRYDFDNAERNAHYFWDHQTLFKMAYETKVGDKRVLFSHAGVGKGWIGQSFPGLKEEDITAELLNDAVGYPPFMDALGAISCFRGGDKEYGSMIWADVTEYLYSDNRYEGIVQVFGHTKVPGPVCVGGAMYCLDCSKAFMFNKEDAALLDLDGSPVILVRW